MTRSLFACALAAAALLAAAEGRAADDVREHNDCVNAEVTFLEAEDFQYAGFKERAMELYRRVLEQRPDHFGAIRKIAELYNQQGKYSDAVIFVDRALKARPEYPGLNDLAGIVYRNVGNAEKSKEFFKKACDMGVTASCSDINQGKAAGGAGGPGAAVGSSQGFKVTAKDGSSEYHYQTGKNLQMQGRYDEALMQFEEAIVKDGKNAKALEEAGYEWSMKGSHEKAVEYYKRALELGAKNAALWDKLGLAYKTAGSMDAAAEAFARACKLGSQVSCTDAQQMGAPGGRGPVDTADLLQLVKDGDLKKAAAELRALVSESPNHFLVHNAYGEYYLRKGDLELALAHAKKAVDLNPSNAEGYGLLSRIFAAQKRKKESGDALRRACQIGYPLGDCPKK